VSGVLPAISSLGSLNRLVSVSLFIVTAVVCVLLVGGSAFAAGRGAPTTLAAANAPVLAFAQDGGQIAWLDESGRRGHVRVRTLATRSQATIGIADLWGDVEFDSARGEETGSGDAPDIAFGLAGTRAVWGGYDISGNNSYGGVAVGTPGERTTELEKLTLEEHFWGDFVTAAAGDGTALVYSTVVVAHTPDLSSANECSQGPCKFTVTGGGVKRVVGGAAVAVPGAPPAVAIAVSVQRVALVPARRSRTCKKNCDPYPVAAANGPVEVRDVTTGALVTRFSPAGTVRAIALSRRFVAVLVRGPHGKRIDRYDAQAGTLVASSDVPSSTADRLGLDGSTIVYSAGRTISLLDARGGTSTTLVTAGGVPLGLSIEGRRVAWAENLSDTHARIRSVTVRG